MKAYKLLRIKKDGKLYPLFINKSVETPIGEWMEAECHPTKGFAIRKGWHCCFKPTAPHLKHSCQVANKGFGLNVKLKTGRVMTDPKVRVELGYLHRE